MSILRIHLLGDFRLLWGDDLLTGFYHPRQQALLAFLLLRRHAPQLRRHLAFTFWPDSSEEQAHSNLRNLLFKVRRALPAPDRFLASTAQTVQWRLDAPYWLDVAEFEAASAGAATAAELERALAFYGGELLLSCYDDWLRPERERLQQVAVTLLQRQVELLEATREWRAAIVQANRLLHLDPLNEATWRTLIRLHAADDDRAGALRVYQACIQRLHDELGVAPDAETQTLYRRLLRVEPAETAPVARARATAAPPPLVGRQAEWVQMRDGWRRAESGSPYLLLLAGEAGIGKTRLAEELLTWVGRQGDDVAAARCYAAEGALPYAPVAAWLRAPALQNRLKTLDTLWRREAARVAPELLDAQQLPPDLSAPVDPHRRQHLFEALARATTAEREPLLLFLDDLQWCDQDTLDWLHFLLRFNSEARLLVLGTLRSEDAPPEHPVHVLLAALRQQGQLVEVTLDRLDAANTAQLATHLASQVLTDRQHTYLYRESEGNPLFIVEMMRAGLHPDGGASRVAVPTTGWEPAMLPPRVHAVLATRLGTLSQGGRELAGLAAAIGREFSLPVLAATGVMPESALVATLDELWERRIIKEHGAAVYDFTHDKLREVAYVMLSAARRRWLHQRIAQALTAVYPDTPDGIVGQLASHYELAGEYTEAAWSYRRAAQAAQRVYANTDAIRYDRRALALLEGPAAPAPGLAVDLHEHLGDMLHFVGQYEEARNALQRALDETDASQSLNRARLLRKIGNTWREQYRYTEALESYTAAMDALEQAPPARSAAWWQAWIATALEINLVYYWQGRVAESDELCQRLQPVIVQYGNPAQRAVFFRETAQIEFRRNRSTATPETVALADAALAAQLEAGNDADIPAAYFGAGFLRLWSGDPQGAQAPLHSALDRAEQSGDISLQARALTYLTVAARQLRQVEATRRLAARSLETATTAHMPEYVAIARANLAWLAWLEGDADQVQECAQEALALWRQLPAGHASAPFQWLALWPLLAIALDGAEGALAIEAAQRLLDPSQQRLPDALNCVLEAAVGLWANCETTAAFTTLAQTPNLAQELHYL
jgi:DNA-binding SARP family transcriptional activator